MHLREMRRWRRGDTHSYALGTFAVLELLRRRPDAALRVVLAPEAVDSDGGRAVAALAARHDVPLDVDARVPAALSGKGNTHAVAAFRPWSAPVAAGADHVVLLRPADAGNLGTIVRTLVGLGMPDLVLVPPAVDLWDPRVVRASMGAVFALRHATATGLGAYRQTHPRTVYALRTDAPNVLGGSVADRFERPCALVFGPESSGLTAGDLTGADPPHGLRIPQAPEIDSFNLAISVAITAWELRRHRAA